MRFTLIIVLTVLGFATQAQLKLGLPSGTADASALLDLSNTGATVFKGFLPPRVALVGTNVQTPILATPALGLLVFNTATAGVAPFQITPGYYYWNGKIWDKFKTVNDFKIDTSIYNIDGTLTSTRTVTMAGKQLNFIGGNLAVGSATATPSAILSISSTTQGLLIPQVTTVQKLAIVAPANGLLVYDVNLNLNCWYNKSASLWMTMNSGTLISADTTFLHNLVFANTANILLKKNNADSIGLAGYTSRFTNNLNKRNNDSTDSKSGYTTLYQHNISANLKKNNADSTNLITGYTTLYHNSLNKTMADSVDAIVGYTTLYQNGLNKLSNDSLNIITGFTTFYQHGKVRDSLGAVIALSKLRSDSVNLSGYTTRFQGNKSRDSVQANIKFKSLTVGAPAISYTGGNVGIGTTTPNAAAVLDLTTTNQGFLLPRLTTAQKTAMAPGSTANGLIVYDSTLNQLSTFNGTIWSQIYGVSKFTPVASSTSDVFYNLSGKVGIGEIAPTAKLEVKDNNISFKLTRESVVGDGSLKISNSTVGAKALGLFVGTAQSAVAYDSTGSFSIIADDRANFSNGGLATNGIKRMMISVLGNVGIGMTPTDAYKLEVNGPLFATTVQVSSDSTLKKNITKLGTVMPKLMQLGSYTYNWKDATKGTALQYGVIAQELEKVFPAMVGESAGTKTVNYLELIPVLMQAIKEQQSKIDQQQVQINQLIADMKK